MIKVEIAIDSFKGSLTSSEAGEAAKAGILRADPTADIDVCPVADGGEGTVDALVSGMNGEWHSIKVIDPLGRETTARYGVVKDNIAVMEMSAAAGLTLLDDSESVLRLIYKIPLLKYLCDYKGHFMKEAGLVISDFDRLTDRTQALDERAIDNVAEYLIDIPDKMRHLRIRLIAAFIIAVDLAVIIVCAVKMYYFS